MLDASGAHGGTATHRALMFQKMVYEHLMKIFPCAGLEIILLTNSGRTFEVDACAVSEDHHLLLFEVKHVQGGRHLPASYYLSISAFKEMMTTMAPDVASLVSAVEAHPSMDVLNTEATQALGLAPPNLVVMTDGLVSPSFWSRLATLGVPIVTVTENPRDTATQLYKALQLLGIDLQELRSA
jgi:hypothetical protein